MKQKAFKPKGCKPKGRRQKRCKSCGNEFTPERPLQPCCSPLCAIQHVRDSKHKKLKAEFYANDLKTRKEAAKKACHAYIRERDKDQPCICCNRPLGINYHAGHYLPSGQNPIVRYDERNIFAQRVDCNYFRGGDSGDYRKNLIERIGLDQVEDVESKKGGTLKRTAQDYREIEEYYKAKLKTLLERRDSTD